MSNNEVPNPPSGRDARRQEKANAAAERARAKASRPWYKKKRFIIPLALVALFILLPALTTGGGDTDEAGDVAQEEPAVAPTEPTEVAEEAVAIETATPEETEVAPPTQPPEPTEPAVEAVAIGEPAADGSFEFTVHGLECGIESVGNETFGQEAQGQYCMLDVTVENVGDSAQSLFADNQYLIDDQGREFSADSGATIYMDNADALFSEINPGNSLDTRIPFDVPQDAAITTARLHDSAFSGGIQVQVE